MSVPCEVQFKFGKEFGDYTINPDPIITDELKDRIAKLLTGQFDIDEDGRCIISPIEWNPVVETRDSICVNVNLGPIGFSYCKDV